MPKQQAFTLIEFMLFISLLTLFSSMALPNMQHFYHKQQSQQAAVALYNFLQHARHSALLLGRTVSVCADNGEQYCASGNHWHNPKLILFTDDNQNGLRDENETLVYTLDLSRRQGSIRWRSFGNKSYLQWQNNGMTFFQNGNFLYCPANKQEHYAFIIVVNILGRLYFGQDKNGDGIVEDSNGNNITCD